MENNSSDVLQAPEVPLRCSSQFSGVGGSTSSIGERKAYPPQKIDKTTKLIFYFVFVIHIMAVIGCLTYIIYYQINSNDSNNDNNNNNNDIIFKQTNNHIIQHYTNNNPSFNLFVLFNFLFFCECFFLTFFLGCCLVVLVFVVQFSSCDDCANSQFNT